MRLPVINMIETGNNIKQLRIKKGMSIKELSVILGLISTQAIYAWEHGTTVPNLEHLLHLSAIFEIEVDELVVVDWIEIQL